MNPDVINDNSQIVGNVIHIVKDGLMPNIAGQPSKKESLL